MRSTGFADIDAWDGWVVGADEVGWGAMAGPLVVCAVAAPVDWKDSRITDSKKLTAPKRERICAEYVKKRREFKVTCLMVGSVVVDQGPARARRDAFEQALAQTVSGCPRPPLVVVDGNIVPRVEGAADVVAYPKADLKVPEVGLASIIAKVMRDRRMVELHQQHPEYNWAKNKGYVTKDHQEALEKFGPVAEHRTSYAPVARVIQARTGVDPRIKMPLQETTLEEDLNDEDFRAALGLKQT